jgi:hypothetical protein
VNSNILSDDELDRLLSEASRTRPVNPAAGDAERVAAALTDLWQSIESSEAPKARSRSTARPVYRRRLAAMGAAAVAVGVASLVGVNSLTGSSGGGNLPLAVSPAAAAQLDRIANGAAGWVGLSAGQWLYVDYTEQYTASEQVGSATVNVDHAVDYQTWTAAAGDQRSRTTNVNWSFATPQDQANYEANKASWDKLGRSAKPIDSGVVFWDLVQPAYKFTDNISPTSDPQTLISEIGAAYGQSPMELQGHLLDIVDESASAQLRATAFAALAYVPGTAVLGSRTDARGRQGIAISLTLPNEYPETMIVDPNTGDILEDHTTAGGITDVRIYGRPAVVDSDTALPGGGTLPIDQSAGLATSTTPAATTTTPSTSTTPETSTSTR